MADARLDNRQELVQLLGMEDLPALDATGLILAAYARWGESCPQYLLGDFRFAVWDLERNQVFCACDPLSVRSLFWAREGKTLWLASEARLILAATTLPATLDDSTVAGYLAGLTEDPGRTFFHNIHRLPPGHFLVATPSGERQASYWDIAGRRAIRYRRNEQYAEQLREILGQAVQDRGSDAGSTVGIAMSGGLDSCSIAALARRQSKAGGPFPFACSLIFDELPECDERPQIAAAAEAFAIEVVPIKADHHWFLSDPDAFRPSLETPFMTWEVSFREMLARAQERGTKVLLTGHGADDVLRGSHKVYADRVRRGDVRAVWEVLRYAGQRKSFRSLILRHYLAAPLAPSWLQTAVRRLKGRRTGPDLPPPWIRGDFARRSGLMDRWAAANSEARKRRGARAEILESLSSLAGDRALAWFDRVASPFGIEVRHPYYDRRLVEFIAAIPPAQLFETGSYKPLLRRAMKGLLPETIRQRQEKARFERLVDIGLRIKEVAQVRRLFNSSALAELGFIDMQKLKSAYQDYLTGDTTDAARALWYAVTLEIWLREYSARLGLNDRIDTLGSRTSHFRYAYPLGAMDHG